MKLRDVVQQWLADSTYTPTPIIEDPTGLPVNQDFRLPGDAPYVTVGRIPRRRRRLVDHA